MGVKANKMLSGHGNNRADARGWAALEPHPTNPAWRMGKGGGALSPEAYARNPKDEGGFGGSQWPTRYGESMNERWAREKREGKTR